MKHKRTPAEPVTKTGQPLKEMLTELSRYYFKEARRLQAGGSRRDWELGKAMGASEAIDAVIFNLYGGEAAYNNWMDNLKACNEQTGSD